MNDRPIHLRKYPFFVPQSHTEDSVTVPVWLTQSSLDGLNALIHYFEGVQGAGRGSVSGSHELIMFYRTIVHSLEQAGKEKEKELTRVANVEERHKDLLVLLNDLAHAWEAKNSNGDIAKWFELNFDELCEKIGRRKDEQD